jgi:hypothetical protein
MNYYSISASLCILSTWTTNNSCSGGQSAQAVQAVAWAASLPRHESACKKSKKFQSISLPAQAQADTAIYWTTATARPDSARRPGEKNTTSPTLAAARHDAICKSLLPSPGTASHRPSPHAATLGRSHLGTWPPPSPIKDSTRQGAAALQQVSLLALLDKYNLSISKIRGQGYDGASNMRGEFNGLQRKILEENPYATYVHCFAQQLQLVVVSVASCCSSIRDFFDYVSLIVTTASTSCKRREALVEHHHERLLLLLDSGEVSTGRGQLQETNLTRPGDTRWGSHQKTLLRIELMWDSVIEVLGIVERDGRISSAAGGLIEKMENFKFVFILKLMGNLFSITNDLSQVLQRKDINIIHAIDLVDDVKYQLIALRDHGWEDFLDEVKKFCEAKCVPVPNMDDEIPCRSHSRRERIMITNLHHYRVELFYVTIDQIIADMNHRFNEATTEILTCFSCLDPKNNFSMFDTDKLFRLAEIYDADFSNSDRALIRGQLETYILQVRRHAAFASCKDVASLAMKMVETGKHLVFPLVYKLIELVLILPVSTASVERSFSAMKIIKSKLRNKIGDEWFNHLMVCYTEREIFKGLNDDTIMRRFQNIKTRKMNLPRHRN